MDDSIVLKAEPGQNLPIRTKVALFCYCPKTRNGTGQGWVVDPDTGYAVCSGCRKPAPMKGIRRCADCHSEFVDFDQELWIVWPNGKVTEAICYCGDC